MQKSLIKVDFDILSKARWIKFSLSFHDTYKHKLCIWAANALPSLHKCTYLPELLHLTNAISIKISCTGSISTCILFMGTCTNSKCSHEMLQMKAFLQGLHYFLDQIQYSKTEIHPQLFIDSCKNIFLYGLRPWCIIYIIGMKLKYVLRYLGAKVLLKDGQNQAKRDQQLQVGQKRPNAA